MRARRSPRWLCALLAVLVWLAPHAASAAPLDLAGQWYEPIDGGAQPASAPLDQSRLRPVGSLSRTGGAFTYRARFRIEQAGRYVVDFKNSSTIGQFRHRIYDARGQLVSEQSGGIQSEQVNPFFLRHGRELELERGAYECVTELRSPFLLGQPEPYVDGLAHYRQSIKAGNALVLVCLGLFVGLALYYAALTLARRRLADGMYTLFILGNLLYNGSALLVYPDLLGVHWFYLVSFPILFSNAAYVAFVMALLEITGRGHPRLHRGGQALLVLFAAFVLVSLVVPSWSLEFDRIGVALFASYGLLAALVRAREGSSSARVYLLAIVALFVLGVSAISLSRVQAHTLYIEHLGLVAVAVEVALLGFVLAHQFSLLHSAKDTAERRAKQSIHLASTDALTGLPNRIQFDEELRELPSHGSLTFVDLDGLKHYNDSYGHQRGDELLCGFATHLKQRLGGQACLYRLGGDEFAITCATGDVTFVTRMLNEAVEALRREDFEFVGASYGSVHVHENPARDELKHMADTRMYEHKGQRRTSLGPSRTRSAG